MLVWVSFGLLLVAIIAFILRQWQLALVTLLLHWVAGAIVLIRRS